MQIDETVHGCPVAMVHLIVRLEILALQVKSGPPRDRRLGLWPAGRAMRMIGAASYPACKSQGCGSQAGRGWDLRHNRPSGFAGRMAVTAACHVFTALAFNPAGLLRSSRG